MAQKQEFPCPEMKGPGHALVRLFFPYQGHYEARVCLDNYTPYKKPGIATAKQNSVAKRSFTA